MKLFDFFMLFFITFILINNCDANINYHQFDSSNYNNTNKIKNHLKEIDLDNYKAEIVKYKSKSEHKIFDHLNEIDTVFVSNSIISVLKSKYYIPATSDYDADLILSELKIINENKIIFCRDSIFSIGIFSYSNNNIISFPIIKSQNPDNFVTVSDLYLLFLNNNIDKCIKKSLINTANAFFALNSNAVFFLDENVLFKYSIDSNDKNALVKFINEYLILEFTIINSSTLEVVFIKDIETCEAYKVNIDFNEQLFN